MTASNPSWLAAGAVLVCAVLTSASPASAQTPPEPGLPAGIKVINISRNTPEFASVFPQVAVSRSDPSFVAVAWRRYNLPIDTNALEKDRVAECYVSISRNGGETFTDRGMMDVLRTEAKPRLWGCNAPWVAIAGDGTLYFGGALFTAGGVLQTEPKAGRAGVTVSGDGGRTWSKMTPGIMIDRFMPGMKGLGGGMEQQDTPWDGANGVADPQTGTFYSTAGAYISASIDKGRTFGTVFEGRGTISAAFGTVVAARIVPNRADAKCPCLVVSTTSDKGKTWSESLVAESAAFDRTGTVRYPVVAASPARAGSYAVAVYEPDHRSVKLYHTTDAARTWRMATTGPVPTNVAVASANMVSTGYTSDGNVLVTWRGFRNPGAFNTFVAMLNGDKFGPTVKVSPELSIYPPLTYAGNYGNGNGGGDFTTWVQGSKDVAFVAFPYAPRGAVLDTFLAKVPVSLLR
jgi:hypothetical protein